MGLKQEELAEKLDISTKSFKLWNWKKAKSPIDILSKIASFLKFLLKHFLDDYDEFKEVKQNNKHY